MLLYFQGHAVLKVRRNHEQLALTRFQHEVRTAPCCTAEEPAHFEIFRKEVGAGRHSRVDYGEVILGCVAHTDARFLASAVHLDCQRRHRAPFGVPVVKNKRAGQEADDGANGFYNFEHIEIFAVKVAIRNLPQNMGFCGLS